MAKLPSESVSYASAWPSVIFFSEPAAAVVVIFINCNVTAWWPTKDRNTSASACIRSRKKSSVMRASWRAVTAAGRAKFTRITRNRGDGNKTHRSSVNGGVDACTKAVTEDATLGDTIAVSVTVILICRRNAFTPIITVLRRKPRRWLPMDSAMKMSSSTGSAATRSSLYEGSVTSRRYSLSVTNRSGIHARCQTFLQSTKDNIVFDNV